MVVLSDFEIISRYKAGESLSLIGPRPSKPIGQGRVPRSNHAGDGYKVYCQRCRFRHWLCSPRSEGCNFGYVKKTNQFNQHLLILRDGYVCYSCGYDPKKHRSEEMLKTWGQQRRLEMQHIRPVSKGGTNCGHNLVWLCSGPNGCHTKLAKGKIYGGIPKSEPHTCPVCESKV